MVENEQKRKRDRQTGGEYFVIFYFLLIRFKWNFVVKEGILTQLITNEIIRVNQIVFNTNKYTHIHK